MAIVFGLENPTFLAKSDILIPKCAKGGSTGLGIIPKKYHFFWLLPLLRISIAIISQNTAALITVTVSYHLHHNICKIKLPNITSKYQQQHQASENILRVEDYYGFQMSSRPAMSSRCHGAEWPNFSLEHKARSLEASSNIRRNHSTHRPSFFGGLDSLQILGSWQNLTHLDFAKGGIVISHFCTCRIL